MPLNTRGVFRDITKWHTERFPDATQEQIGLKLCSEAGEVADAINANVGTNSNHPERDNVPEECADVIIVCAALMGRFYPDRDLWDEIAKKLAILTDPKSGHPASLISPAIKTTLGVSIPKHLLESSPGRSIFGEQLEMWP